MTYKLVTEEKMKWRQETTSLSQTATVMAKQQRMVVWLIYRQFECQEEVIFVIFPCASENISCQ